MFKDIRYLLYAQPVKQLFSLVLKYKYVFILCVLFAGFLAADYAKKKVSMYEVSSVVMFFPYLEVVMGEEYMPLTEDTKLLRLEYMADLHVGTVGALSVLMREEIIPSYIENSDRPLAGKTSVIKLPRSYAFKLKTKFKGQDAVINYKNFHNTLFTSLEAVIAEEVIKNKLSLKHTMPHVKKIGPDNINWLKILILALILGGGVSVILLLCCETLLIMAAEVKSKMDHENKDG